jgi:hypothetical protein
MAQGTTRGVPIDIDPLLTNDSDLLVPSQKAIKTYVDTNTSNAVSAKVSRSGDTMSGSLILSGDPTIPFGAATKSYVDTLINGIDWKTAANAATTTALPTYTVSGAGQILTGTVTLGLIDGVTLTANQRILVKDETSTQTPNNGIYVVTQVNPFILTRSNDANTSALLAEATISVAAGDTLSNTQWHCNPATTPIIIGTTYITFAEIGSGTYSFNPPLVDTGSVISIPSATNSVDGYLSSTDWTNFNTAYTSRISTFSVTGNSGAATFSGNTLNIPEYTLSGLGGAGLALDNTFTGSNTFTYNDSESSALYINNSLGGGGLNIGAGDGVSANIAYGITENSIGIKLYGGAAGDGVPLIVYNSIGYVAQISSGGVITCSALKVLGGFTTGFLKANGDIDSRTFSTGGGTATGTNTGDETAARIGVLINGSATAVPNDADFVATADTSVLKKITWTSVKAFLKTYFDTLYSDRVYNITISGTANIDTNSPGSYNSVSGYGQNGRNVMIQNLATPITITCLSTSTTDFIATYTKLGSAAISFFAGTLPSAVTLITVSGLSQITGSPGSTALLTRTGNTYYLLINNI